MATIPAGSPDPNAPTPQQAAAAAVPATPSDKLLADGMQVASAGVSAVASVIDSLFGQVENALPAVTGDALKVAIAVVEHAIPDGIIKDAITGGLLAGLGTNAAASLEKTLDSAGLALLALAKARVDSYAADVEKKL